MDTAAIAPTPLQPLTPATGALGRLAALPAKAKLMLGGGIAALAAVVVALSVWGSQGDYKVLYAGLSDKDAGAIVTQLSQMGVPYKNSEGGNAILVPADKVHDARFKLAAAGLPKGSVAGFELMDNARFGQTQFQERLTFQRGLEGELTRSISSLAAVQAARVHLALPNQNGFFREQQKPSASVLLTMFPGRTLDRAQIAGIVHLVSSSVPELSPKAVSVLDQTGALLSDSGDANGQPGLDANQLRYVSQIEATLQKRIQDILEPVVGRDNLRATVAAEVDFSQVESTSEEFKPNQGDPAQASVRSQQSSESSNGAGATPSGVPGAMSNQPPVAATAPLTGASAPLQGAQAGAAANGNARRDRVVNYEVDKTVRVTRGATGNVKRLNVAVVVNHRSNTAANGKVTTTPLAPEELDKLTALVQESVGYSKERGDSVRVINAPFKTDSVKPEAMPLWQQPWLLDMLRAGAVPGALALVALAVIFGLVKPALKAAQNPPAPVGTQLDVVADDDDRKPPPLGHTLMPVLEAPKVSSQLEGARKLAKENPAAVANIVRGWVSGETA
jgi:flagellar M-ring protein FliF